MRLTLTIENFSRRPDGGPLSYVVDGARVVDIGRHPHLDWCLPDENNYVSGRHCEIRGTDDGYVLTDVSRNGVFVNGEERRVQSPYRLANGDRLFIGDYIIAVRVDGVASAPAVARSTGPGNGNFWGTGDAGPPPIDSETLKPKPESGAQFDWVDQLSDPPAIVAPASPYSPPTPAAGASIWRPAAHREPPELAPTREVPLEAPTRASAGEASARERGDAGATSDASASAADRHDVFLAAFARGLGVSEQHLAALPPQEFGEKLGALMRLIAEDSMQLLKARAEAKRVTRSATRTVVESQDNNPLKFAPTAEQALRILFGPPRGDYLDARGAFTQAFYDLKTHQLRTYAAMQDAVRRLSARLDPERLRADTTNDAKVAAFFGSRKARLWDLFIARWDALSPRGDDKLTDAFMRNFADCYDDVDARR
jgi:type VI secretion system protein ImpI